MTQRTSNIVRPGRASKALWIPALWLFFAGSRSVSSWLQIRMIGTAADDQLQGSPLDRLVFTLLIVCALIILSTRARKVGALLGANLPILLFLAYCGVSILWSDFPSVAFKRWIRGAGDIAMVLVVLTDARPSVAVKALLARIGFILLPLSVLCDIVRPFYGMTYHYDSGVAYYNGVTTNKNLYGVIAMVLGLAAAWRFLTAWRSEDRRGRTRELTRYGALTLLAVFCLWMANSATSTACFALGIIVLEITRRWSLGSKPAMLHVVVASLVFLALYSVILNPNLGVVATMGKDPTLTGRTDVWKAVIPMNPDPMFGAGFESFWLGPRLKRLWDLFPWKPNEAHNGYIEVYLNLGWVGLFLLGVIIVNGYRKVVRGLRRDPEGASLRLAYLVVAVVYSLTEAGFRIFNPIWIIFLMAVIPVSKAHAQQTAGRRHAGPVQQLPSEESQLPVAAGPSTAFSVR